MAWLERLLAKLNRKLTPTAAAMGGQNEAPIMASEVAREEEEETEGQAP